MNEIFQKNKWNYVKFWRERDYVTEGQKEVL